MPLPDARFALPLACAVVGAGCGAAPPAAAPPAAQARVEASPWESPLLVDHPLVGRIFDRRTGREIHESELVVALRPADALVLGEQHDNADHHLLQARIIDALARSGETRSVVFEQVELSQQAVLDARGGGDLDALATALRWSESGWPAFALYRPVFGAALRHGWSLRAGSLDRDTTMALSREGLGVLDPALVERYQLAAELPEALRHDLAQEMQDAHCGLLPEAMLDSMVTVQRARDATLAEALHAAGKGAVLVAGNGHARTDRGVPRYLADAYGARVVSLAFEEVRPDAQTLQALTADPEAEPFDYVWLTPKASDEDHCAKLRERFGGAHGEHGEHDDAESGPQGARER